MTHRLMKSLFSAQGRSSSHLQRLPVWQRPLLCQHRWHGQDWGEGPGAADTQYVWQRSGTGWLLRTLFSFCRPVGIKTKGARYWLVFDPRLLSRYSSWWRWTATGVLCALLCIRGALWLVWKTNFCCSQSELVPWTMWPVEALPQVTRSKTKAKGKQVAMFHV